MHLFVPCCRNSAKGNGRKYSSSVEGLENFWCLRRVFKLMLARWRSLLIKYRIRERAVSLKSRFSFSKRVSANHSLREQSETTSGSTSWRQRKWNRCYEPSLCQSAFAYELILFPQRCTSSSCHKISVLTDKMFRKPEKNHHWRWLLPLRLLDLSIAYWNVR